MENKKSRYSESGVDISQSDDAKARLADIVRGTFTPNVIGDFGGFGSAFSMKGLGTENALVSSADGVGTKLKVAFMANLHDTVGHDLVNHLTNDILCMGARPLFFMDYIGLGKMDGLKVTEIVKGIATGCKENGCALLGGETAEMPRFYANGEYDLAGFMVGVTKKEMIPDKAKLKPGDFLIGFSSSGLHTNGYSLARKAFFEIGKMSLDQILPETGKPLSEELLAVHRSYLKTLYKYLESGIFKAAAHITGGGFEGNISRILPPNLDAVIDTHLWNPPGVFRAIQRLADVSAEEMYRVFNMGIGMVTVVAAEDVPYLKKTMVVPECEVVPVGALIPGCGKVMLKL
ncbi:MAG TPA: phosphoribosylformylglycinamidine cyclo-ligase [candidate division Zixibacteria bacterium]|nr:phosphoribosylformylglycinamidine cyclo-ligase [candidate division Zixibacteria bacterium]